jgi:hypothetical protein
MWSKHAKPYDPRRLTAPERVARDVEELFAANLASASFCQSHVNNMAAAGVPQLGKRVRSLDFKNAARNWKKSRLKKTFWPEHYEFEAPVWSRNQQEIVEETLAMWLPLEILAMIWSLGIPEVMLQVDGMDTQTLEHLNGLKAKLGVPNLWGFAIHGDGVPNNYDRTENCQVISISLPGLDAKGGRLRIPLCVLPSRKMCNETMDAIMEVIAWSLRHLQCGCRPAARHDGSEWQSSDKERARKSGQPLEFNASLVEVRGDWDFYSKVFHFPYHSELDGICWRCDCKRSQVIAS